MCDKCFNSGRSRFESKAEFNVFEDILERKCASDSFLSLTNKHGEYRTLRFCVYECSNCNTKWAFSIPKYHWRGFFVQIDESNEYFDKLIRTARKKALLIGSAIVSLMTFALYLYAIYYN